MKIILLNPHVDAVHRISQELSSRGVAVLLPLDTKEALQILQLHGTSVDLAVIHKEGLSDSAKDPGLTLVAKIKGSAGTPQDQSDLPMILTSEIWREADFTTHQATEQGVNAYLAWPYSSSQLGEMLEAILGVTLKASAKTPPTSKAPESPKAKEAPPLESAPQAAPVVPFDGPEGGTVLQDIREVFNEPSAQPSLSGIRFEAPEMEDLAAPQEVGVAPVEVSEPPSESPSLSTPESAAESIAESAPDLGRSALLESLIQPSGDADPAPVEAPSLLSEAPSLITEAPPSAEISPADTSPVEPLGTSPALEFSMAALVAPPPSGQFQEEPEQEPEVQSPSEDLEAIQEMPYIFGKKKASDTPKQSSIFAEAMGDAIIPGGVAQTPDLETIKKYLLLREQDVAVLSTQLKAIQGQVQLQDQMLREERAKNAELTHVANEQKQKIDDFEKEKLKIIGKFETEMQELNFQIKAKVDKARIFESQIEESSEEMEHLKERVRSDIRKIRVREKELENRLEIMKKDSEALMAARESKIIELKRKLDLLEFNMDLLQDQYNREKERSALLRERLSKAAQIVRVAEGLLDSPKGKSEKALEERSTDDSSDPKSSDLTGLSSDLLTSSGRQAS